MREYATKDQGSEPELTPRDYKGCVAVGRFRAPNGRKGITTKEIRALMRKHGGRPPSGPIGVARILQVSRQLALADDDIRRKRVAAALKECQTSGTPMRTSNGDAVARARRRAEDARRRERLRAALASL